MELYSLKTNERMLPIGIDGIPYFSWKIRSSRKNVMQTAYRIVIDGMWDSGRVASRQQAFVEYGGKPLAFCTEYTWRLSVWDSTGEYAEAEAHFETARVTWKARWVESTVKRIPSSDYSYWNSCPPIIFRREFSLPEKRIVKARVYSTAYGVYRLKVNAMRPDDREFAPEYTAYDKLLYYQTYDVTKLLRSGMNRIEMYVADGWYFSHQATPVRTDDHTEYAVLFQMEIWYADGTRETVYSDGSETCALGPLLYSDLFQGEKQDLRRVDEEKHPVAVKNYGYETLLAQPTDAIRPVILLPAADVFTTPNGDKVVDFGQVLSGRARIQVDLPDGEAAVFEYFEILDKDGNYINTMFSPQKDTVISAGKPVLHEALFTFHGFRYIRVTGIKDVRKENFTAVLLTTEKENAGTFICSEPRLNRLYQNIRWSQRNNMMSVPTDCPTREKAGWTGDILVYSRTALTNENMTSFLSSWLLNVRKEQRKDGTVMITSPFAKIYDWVLGSVYQSFGDTQPTNVAGWSDAIVWIPYEMYRVTGNTLILRENYDAMCRFCDAVIRTAAHKCGDREIPEDLDRWLFNTGFHFGEWLIPSEPVGGFDICKSSSYYAAPFYAYESIRKMAEIAKIVCCPEDAARYTDAAAHMKDAIIRSLIYADKLPEDKMGFYVLAFAFDLVPDELRNEYASRLLRLLEANSGCLDTGFLATAYLLDVLCMIGHPETAHALLWQNKMPSWLYEVEQGATAIWEAWNADEARHTPRTVSFDHYAFGIVDDWIMRHLCGIDSDVPGYSHLIIAPYPDPNIIWLKRSFDSQAGEVKVEYEGKELTVTIPPNASATVIWNGKKAELGSGTYTM